MWTRKPGFQSLSWDKFNSSFVVKVLSLVYACFNPSVGISLIQASKAALLKVDCHMFQSLSWDKFNSSSSFSIPMRLTVGVFQSLSWDKFNSSSTRRIRVPGLHTPEFQSLSWDKFNSSSKK